MSSRLMVAKKDSATALSQPFRPIERTTPLLRARVAKSQLDHN
jgi:hypothetical protein